MEYPIGYPTCASFINLTGNPSSNHRYRPSSDLDVLKRGIKEAQVSLKRYLIGFILFIILSLFSRKRLKKMRQ